MTTTYRIDTSSAPKSRKDEFFRQAVAGLKRSGGTFDPATKTWAVDGELFGHDAEKMLDRGVIVEVA